MAEIGSDAWYAQQAEGAPAGDPTETPGSVTSGPGGDGKGPSQQWQGKTDDQYTEENAPASKDSQREIIGLHPSAYYEPSGSGPEQEKIKKLAYAWAGIVHIWPCWPEWGGSGEDESAFELFKLSEEQGMEEYKKVINNTGVVEYDENKHRPLNIAFLNDIAIGESWTNSYGASKFESLANIGSSTIQELRSITGARTLPEMIRKMTGDTMAAGVGGVAAGGVEGLQGQLTGLFGNNAQAIMQLFMGSRVDFPAIWQGSNYSPSYQITVRLYNPNPKSPEMYEKHILQPLCSLMALAIPISDSQYTYSYPVLIKARCPGMFQIDAGYVSDIQVIKGGEAQDFTWQQQPGMIDVRMSLNTLYGTMIATSDEEHESEQTTSQRPTLKKYFANLKDWINYDYPFGKKASSTPETAPEADISITKPPVSIPDSFFDNPFGRISSVLNDISNTIAAGLGGITNILGQSLAAFGVLTELNNIFGSVSNGINNIFAPINSLISNGNSILSLLGLGSTGSNLNSILGILNTILDAILSILNIITSILSIIDNIIDNFENIETTLDNRTGMLSDAEMQNILRTVADAESIMTPSVQITDQEMTNIINSIGD